MLCWNSTAMHEPDKTLALLEKTLVEKQGCNNLATEMQSHRMYTFITPIQTKTTQKPPRLQTGRVAVNARYHGYIHFLTSL